MQAVGVRDRKSVNIMGHNSPEWVIAFMGTSLFNCVASGVYPTNNAEACLYQADHSEAELIVVDSVEQLKKYVSILPKLPNIKAIVVYNIDNLPKEYATNSKVFLWDDFLLLGKGVADDIIRN